MSRDLDGTTDYLTTTGLPGGITGYPVTMACWARLDAASAGETLMALVDNATTNTFVVLDTSATPALRAGVATTGTVNNAVSPTTLSTGVWFHACATFASATARAVYLNGAGKGTSATSRLWPSGMDQLCVGMLRDSTPTGDIDGRIAEACVWNVALSDAEVAALASGASPYLIRPGNLIGYWPIWGNASPEPDYNPAGAKLSLAITGTAAQAGHSPTGPMLFDDEFWGHVGAAFTAYTLDAQPGSFAITGANATLAMAKFLDCQPGSFAVTGAAATLSRGGNLNAQPGSFAITGVAATLLGTLQIPASPGAFVVTGIAATLSRGGNLDAQPGSFAITGAAAQLQSAFALNAQPGSYAVTGVAATLSAGRVLNAQPGAYVITGVEAELLHTEAGGTDYALDAQPGSFIVTGAPATLSAGWTVNAEPGSYAITGVAASLLGVFQLNAQPGAFTFTGFDATLALAGIPQLPLVGDIVLVSATGEIRVIAAEAEIALVSLEGGFAVIHSDGTITTIRPEGDIGSL